MPPPELSVRGTKETWDVNLWGLAESNRERWEFRPLSVVRGGDAPSPLQNVPLRGQKKRGGRETGRWRLVGFNRDSRESRRVQAAFVFQGGHSVAPSRMICPGMRKRRGRRKSRPETRRATELTGERWRI